ncbi:MULTISPECIES: hypothetical protein [unclassified Microcoleus]
MVNAILGRSAKPVHYKGYTSLHRTGTPAAADSKNYFCKKY